MHTKKILIAGIRVGSSMYQDTSLGWRVPYLRHVGSVSQADLLKLDSPLARPVARRCMLGYVSRSFLGQVLKRRTQLLRHIRTMRFHLIPDER